MPVAAFEIGAKPAYEQLIGAVKDCTGGSAQDSVLAELAWSTVHGFVELQLLLETKNWEEKAVAMLERLRVVFERRDGQVGDLPY
jgi:hypothetical protein